ncbi:MAG: peptidoglycan DD-metalloendopeptidase family protein [Firmicutes bacterium]|nr:peptidoglycan DD-metalloendopeptidase family protein [Bacillota bacterium]
MTRTRLQPRKRGRPFHSGPGLRERLRALFRQRVTFVWMPQSHSRVRRITISRFTAYLVALVSGAILTVFLVAAVGRELVRWQLAQTSQAYRSARSVISQLKAEAAAKDRTLAQLSADARQLEERMKKLQQLTSEASDLLGYSTQGKAAPPSSEQSGRAQAASRSLAGVSRAAGPAAGPHPASPPAPADAASGIPPQERGDLGSRGLPPGLRRPASAPSLSASLTRLIQSASRIQDTQDQLANLHAGIPGVKAELGSLESALADYSRRLQRIPCIWPVAGSITEGYGWRQNPVLHVREFHPGVDIAGPYGATVAAAAQGVVTYAGWLAGYGNIVSVDHGNGFVTRYAHLSRILVRTGQTVTRGQTLGLVGATGLANGPHLHYEVWVSGSTVNPTAYLP